DPAVQQPLDRKEAVAEVRLRRRTGAYARAPLAEQVELASVGMRRVDDRRVGADAAAVGEELDRPGAMLCKAFLDLPRLLVRVDVERQPLRRGVASELDEPFAWACAHGVGSDADADSLGPELLELLQVLGDRALAEALDPAARVCD